jgi:hypothetical protein
LCDAMSASLLHAVMQSAAIAIAVMVFRLLLMRFSFP